MPNQTLYDNFSQVRQYIDQEKPDLSSYVTKTELSNCGYLTSIPVKYPTLTGFTIPTGATEIKFRSGGLGIDNTTYDLFPSTITYSSAALQSNRAWVGMGTLKNYVDGRISEIESSYATTTYVADYVAEHGGGEVTYSYLSDNYLQLAGGTIKGTTYIKSGTYLYLGTDRPWKLYGTGGGSGESVVLQNQVDGKHFYIKDINYNNIVDIHNNLTGSGFVKFSYNVNTYTNNIVPNENNTYTLGTSSVLFSNVYSKNINVDSSIKLWQANTNEMDINLSNTTYYFFNNERFAPSTAANHNKLDLGKSDRSWKTTYTQSLYLNSYNIVDTINGIFSYDTSTGTLTITTIS